jgi:hypothetical protein
MIAVVFFMCYDIFILAFSDGEMNNNTTWKMQGESGGGVFSGADLIGDISDHNPMMPTMGSYTGLLYD